MRLSCNGCRVLRKGCSDDCTIRPCLEWIKSPDSQSNATLFLAKFYGRTGLLNLINSGSPDVRPAIFKSLLHEACGRIVNPIHGSVGLMCTGKWNLCQTAVQAVLNGTPITQMTIDQTKTGPAVKGFDIRHVNKVEKTSGSSDLSRVRSRCRFKRTGCKVKRSPVSVGSGESDHEVMMNNKRSPSHDSSLSHQSEHVAESVRLPSAEVVEPEARAGSELDLCERRADDGEIELELTLRL